MFVQQAQRRFAALGTLALLFLAANVHAQGWISVDTSAVDPVVEEASAIVASAAGPLPPAPAQVPPTSGGGSSAASGGEEPASPAPAQPAPTRQAPTVGGLTQTVTDGAARADKLVDRAEDWLPVETVEGLAHDAAATAEEAARTLPIPGQGAAPGEAEATPDEPAMAPAAAQAMPIAISQGIVAAAVAGAAAVALWLAAGTSSTVGATGAASAGSKFLGRELKDLLPYASPLFTRFERDTVLGHPRREALYALILQNPGISLQALGDATGLSRTATLHHLRLMERQHLIVSRRMGRSRHFFENGGRFGRDQKAAYAVLQNARSRQVAEFVEAHPGVHQKDLCDALGLAPSIAHWHVRRLQDAQLIECRRDGRNVAYLCGAGLSEVLRAAPGMPAAEPAVPALMPAVTLALPNAA